ncbi:MAG: hypothetical protein K2O14_08865 [Oscillospiraceae bacterium]|nr:hypothetical protein [Oscillospiraceae bacterium]
MKKALIITVCCFTACCLVIAGICLLAFRERYDRERYDIVKFSVEQEPDGVFSSRHYDELFMIVDGEIRSYDQNGSYDTWDIDIDVREIFPCKDELWLIDQNNDLYRYSSGESTLILNDVVDFDVFGKSYAAILGSGEVYVWGKDLYMYGASGDYSEEPVLVENISGAKRVKLSNFYVLLLDKDGQLYEDSMLVDESQRGFKKIEGLEPIREIYSGYGTIAVAASGKTYYWFKSYNSGAVDPDLDTSVIASRCEELRVKNYSPGTDFWAACTEQGEVCWWGVDEFRKSYDKSIHFVSSPEKLPHIKNAENVYSGAFVMYIKSGTDFYIV